MLRNKLFAAFVALVVMIGALSAFFGIRIIQRQVVGEAQKRVRLDLAGAWSVFDGKLREIDNILRLAAESPTIIDAAAAGQWEATALRSRVDGVRHNFKLDFIGLTDSDGVVRMRADSSRPPGDVRTSNPLIARALKGETGFGPILISGVELEREASGLAERAYIVIEDTPHARPSPRQSEDRGLVLMGAVPVYKGPQLLGVLYAGILLNRNAGLIDRIYDLVYHNDTYEGHPIGAATIFLHDCRIATTVRSANGNRAIGTRVSKEVADRVLDNGLPWIDRAFVVTDYYLTAYDPIRDANGGIVGMLYCGLLEKPFKDLEQEYTLRYAGLLLFGLLAAIVFSLIIASRIASPVHKLVEATHNMTHGKGHVPLHPDGGCREISSLIESFNLMAATIEERDRRIREDQREMEEANRSLDALNRSYMDMLSFVSHELKVPVGSVRNYLYLLAEGKLGALNDKQLHAVTVIDRNNQRMAEMVRHYLNLARIENGELEPVRTRFALLPEIVKPVLETLHSDIESRALVVDVSIGEDVALLADIAMVREVFDNLISNAVKYGRDGGRLSISCRPGPEFHEFAVGNEGAGIPADKLALVFQKFARLDPGNGKARQKGTGLGLFITKFIVEAHGGHISVESDPGRWTEFKFTLPAAPPAAS